MLSFPRLINLAPGSFLLKIDINGETAVIPHVATVDVDPSQPNDPVVATLLGPKPLNAWRAATNGCVEHDTVYALVIPDEPGRSWPSYNAAYKSGCMIFDGTSFNYCGQSFGPGHSGVRYWCDERVGTWRSLRGLPPLPSEEPAEDA